MLSLLEFLKHRTEEPINMREFVSWGDITAKGHDQERKDYGRGMLLYFLVKTTAPKRILEIGTGRGYSATCMVQALRSIGVDDFSLTTIDVDHHKKARVRPDGVVASVHDMMTVTLGDLTNIEFRNGESKSILPKLTGPYDFIFVDGSHKTDPVIFDCEQSLRLISDKGIIVFHDYKCPSTKGVTQALDACMPNLQKKYDIFEVFTRGDFNEDLSEYITTGEMGSLVCLPKQKATVE